MERCCRNIFPEARKIIVVIFAKIKVESESPKSAKKARKKAICSLFLPEITQKMGKGLTT